MGRLKQGPEAALVEDYLARARQAGRSLGFTAVDCVEQEAATAGDKPREAELLRKATPAGAKIILLSERGEAWTSRKLSKTLAKWRDEGAPAIAFWIGGPDGTDAALDPLAHAKLAFGPATWPHKLARVMLAEQIYRAFSIEAGSPYHRD